MKTNLKWSLLCVLISGLLASCSSQESESASDIHEGESSSGVSAVDLGSTSQAITYGVEDEGDPAVVGLFIVSRSEPNDRGGNTYWGRVNCTGTLIHPQWVLTAAHCVVDTDDGVKPSENNKNLKIAIGPKYGSLTIFDIAGEDQIYWPKDYKDAINNGRDIALIKLSEPMSDKYAKPILPYPSWLSLNSSDMPINMTLVGFGYDETGTIGVKHKIANKQIEKYCGPANASDSRSGCSLGSLYLNGCHPNQALCEQWGNYDGWYNTTMNYGTFYYSRKTGGACNGDSGGPTLLTKGGVEYVTSVTSWGDTPCRTYSIQTAVQDYYDWITSVAPEVAYQYKEICGNGIDDDGNGKVDDYDPACIFCGNGIVNIGEQCDKTEFSGNKNTCERWSTDFSGGTLRCKSDCTVDTSGCDLVEYCGDGKLSEIEECDGSQFRNDVKTCAEYDSKYTTGSLKCTNSCRIDASECRSEAKCGDGKVNGSEVCDGTSFLDNRSSCSSLYPDIYSGGLLKCSNSCEYDTSLCVKWCGNGQLNRTVGEACDGDKFGGETCETLIGPGSKGKLKCTNGCTVIDTSNCSKPVACGDGTIDAGEECEGSTFYSGRIYCSDWDSSYTKGKVTCNANCTVNYSQCERGPVCGNGTVDTGEQCDGTKFSGGKTSCNTLFPSLYSGGTVKCSDSCEYDTSACIPWCGNGSVNTKSGEIILNEACDHSAAGDKFPTSANTCEKVVGKGSTGKLICSDDCSEIIKTGCSEPAYCGDGIVNNTEQCDDKAFLNNKTKCSDWDSKYESGNVACTARCGLDFTDCVLKPVCGDKIVNGSEECDGLNFKTDSVMCSYVDSKYVAGRISCKPDCTIDYSACQEEIIIPDEICTGGKDEDGDGKIDCDDPDCINDEACKSKDVCGDGIVNGDEECDGNAFLLDEDRCSEWMTVFKTGKVGCSNKCIVTYDNCSTTMPEICDNGKDDSGNGRTDCDDPECINFPACIADTDPDTEDCGNGKDDDGNGKADCDDPACSSLPVCHPDNTEICDNKLDDDGNGKVDCDDDACAAHEACKPVLVEICGNGKDDDGNGRADCEDSACAEHESCQAIPVEICDNGKDDDGNGKTDCDDDACTDHVKCKPLTPEICGNHVDDDGNGKTDCEDPACADKDMCKKTEDKPGDPSTKPETPEEKHICENGVDDNNNGKIDCDDDVCKDYPACAGKGDGKDKDDGGCSATPNGRPNATFPLFMLFGAGALLRRRRMSK